MKCYIEKVVLFLKGNYRREIEFMPNKINVITGESETGKTTIMKIIDYCLFSSKVKIPEQKINENVDWYGLILNIGEKKYTIIRGAISNTGLSSKYYFDSEGKLPDVGFKENISEKDLKKVIEAEFNITNIVTVPFGGKKIKKGSQISLRYFLLFNTQTNDIISSENILFDKQTDQKYIEALHRVFDLSIGVEEIPNLVKKSEKEKLELKRKKLSEKLEKKLSDRKIIPDFIEEKVKRAKEYGMSLPDIDDQNDLNQLELNINSVTDSVLRNVKFDEYKKVSNKVNNLKYEIRNLEMFTKSVKKHKENIKLYEESLKPVEYIQKNDDSILKTSVYDFLMEGLKNQLEDIVSSLSGRIPIEINIHQKIDEKKKELKALTKKLESLPSDIREFKNNIEKAIFIGEFKENIRSAKQTIDTTEIESEIEDLDFKISEIEKEIIDITEKRNLAIHSLEEHFQYYWTKVGDAAKTYKDYIPFFSYKDKNILLKKPLTDYPETTGSSSNHLFRHLCFFLAFHHLNLAKSNPFIIPLLILDQPSRPFLTKLNDKKDGVYDIKEDPYKLKKYFKVIDDFLSDLATIEKDATFQFLTIEHIPWEDFSSLGYKNLHLAADFYNDFLIPQDYLDSKESSEP